MVINILTLRNILYSFETIVKKTVNIEPSEAVVITFLWRRDDALILDHDRPDKNLFIYISTSSWENPAK